MVMSRKYSAVPPVGFAQISSLNAGPLKNDGFAIPLPPQKKPSANSTASDNDTATQPSRKRRSRFSDAPPTVDAPPPPTVLTELPTAPPKRVFIGGVTSSQSDDKSALMSAAAAAAARINANLKAQGKIKDTAVSAQLTSQSTVSTTGGSHPNPVDGTTIRHVDDMYSTEVVINDIPIGCRNYLTRLSTQESINKSCMAYVSTRGKYMTAEDKLLPIGMAGSEKPLYLFIQSQNETNLKKALDRIRQIINNHFEKKSMYQSQALAQIASLSQKGLASAMPNATPPSPQTPTYPPGYPPIPDSPVSPLPASQPALPCGNFVQEKLFIGLDQLPDVFDLKNKLLGPNYRNFNFIANQTGARVILRGKGSGFVEPTSGREAFESMYAFVSHPNQSGVDAAKRLVRNLIDTIKRDIPPDMLQGASQRGSNGNSYGYTTGGYTNIPPPVMGPQPGFNRHPAPVQSSMIAYPFQQATLGQPSAAASLSSSCSYENSYQNFQPNFSENKAVAESNTETTKSKSRKDKPRKS